MMNHLTLFGLKLTDSLKIMKFLNQSYLDKESDQGGMKKDP